MQELDFFARNQHRLAVPKFYSAGTTMAFHYVVRKLIYVVCGKYSTLIDDGVMRPECTPIKEGDNFRPFFINYFSLDFEKDD